MLAYRIPALIGAILRFATVAAISN